MYIATVIFAALFSWLIYAMEKQDCYPIPLKRKLMFLVMPFIPYANVAWIVFMMV